MCWADCWRLSLFAARALCNPYRAYTVATIVVNAHVLMCCRLAREASNGCLQPRAALQGAHEQWHAPAPGTQPASAPPCSGMCSQKVSNAQSQTGSGFAIHSSAKLHLPRLCSASLLEQYLPELQSLVCQAAVHQCSMSLRQTSRTSCTALEEPSVQLVLKPDLFVQLVAGSDSRWAIAGTQSGCSRACRSVAGHVDLKKASCAESSLGCAKAPRVCAAGGGD